MARRVGGAELLARVALASVLVTSCAQTQPESAGPTSIDTIAPATHTPEAATDAPEPTAASGAHVTIHWEPLDELKQLLQWEEPWIVHDGETWMTLGSCPEDQPVGCLLTWTSSDTRSWTERLVDSPSPSSFGAAAGATGFVIAADNEDRSGKVNEQVLNLWTSPSGESWTRVEDFNAGECGRGGCPNAYGLALAPSGAIVIGTVGNREDIPYGGTGPFVSRDGPGWKRVSRDELGVDEYRFSQFHSLPSELLISGNACEGCDPRLWRTTDGVSWEEAGTFPIGDGQSQGAIQDVATDGEVTVASVHFLDDAASSFEAQLWSSQAGGPWIQRFLGPETGLQLFYSGSAFVALGHQNWDDPVQLTSFDGIHWTLAPGDMPPIDHGEEDCGGPLTAAAGIVVKSTWECGIWRGTVEVMP
jgi:hypothetical protein